jgi:hypothetical protein
MNNELRALYEEDRQDAQTFRGEESFVASQARRSRVEALLAAGAVQVAEDFFHASFIFQHGERLEHWAQAHLLARTAAERGHPQARYQAAAAYDRWLMRQGQPQKYGTNSILDPDQDCWRVWDTDPATTDAERAAWDVPSWAELLARGQAAFGGKSVRAVFAEPFVTAQVQGVEIGLFDPEPMLPGRDFPIYAVPPYMPLQPADPRPRDLPEDTATCWRFGNLYCAKDAVGAVLCTWHPCRWRVLGPKTIDPAALYAVLAGQPQWMSADGAFWHRLGLATGPERCWVVGGRRDCFSHEALAQLASSLPE